MKLRKVLTTLALAAALTVGVAGSAWAGSPHFVDDKVTATQTGDTLTVSGKEAGLGDEAQIHVVLSADVQCVNPGGNDPQAANKQTFSVDGDFPVQSGHAEFALTLAPVLQPRCVPPMTLRFSNVVVTDQTNGLTFIVGFEY